MPKNYHCAACGKSLTSFLKAIPKRGKVLKLIEPHTCNPDEVVEDYEFLPEEKEKKEDFIKESKPPLDFSFVKKLNVAPDTNPLLKDKRDKKHQREKIQTSIAPPGILQRTKASSHVPSHPEREFKEL